MDEKVDLDKNIDIAIKVEKASIAYSCGNKTSTILRDLDLEVPKGKIYGLLGPSGCGKTTLLKCLLGKLALDYGQVHVFGSIPGCRSTGVPGKRVGYMPQELALFGEFNIAETLEYFSRLYGMSRDKYQERMDFLLKFLDLPSKTRQLEKMSGGQQRRASLAVALLHEPDLLILDEPTVGVDPLLRSVLINAQHRSPEDRTGPLEKVVAWSVPEFVLLKDNIGKNNELGSWFALGTGTLEWNTNMYIIHNIITSSLMHCE